jgi:Tol biopolymer transport system component
MPLSKGERLGSYLILGPVGMGGMGEVYRARDTRLDREVAIKILPEAFATDPNRLRWFRRESKTLGALSHPNILAIFDVGMQGNTWFLVTELLKGKTLRECTQGSPLPLRSVIEYSAQIAKGLAAAHAKGIVHRDLKPDNIFVTTENQIKILDFGLAKQVGTNLASDKIVSSTVTVSQVVVGTTSYMSPELVRGGSVDARSDIFSFGAVLYEMLFGRMAFRRESAAETMNAIVNNEPAGLAEPHSSIPTALQLVLRKCLEKAAEQRFQSASDLAFAIEAWADVCTSARSGEVVPAPAALRLWFMAVASLVGVIVAAVLISALIFKSRSPKFRQLIFGRGFVSSARFTPDGESVVYGAAFGGRAREIYLTRLDGQSSRHMGLPPADILGISRHGEMAVSLGRHNYYYWMVVGTLGLAPLSGGPARAILPDVCDGDIGADGKDLGIVRCGGVFETLEYPIGKVLFRTSGWISHPRISPAGNAIAFLEHPLLGDDRGYVSLVDTSSKAKRLTQEWSSEDGIAWAPSGQEVWFTSSMNTEPQSLRAVKLSGPQRVVLSTVSDLSLHDIDKTGNVLLASARDSTEVAVGHKGQRSDRILEVADENAGVAGISNDGKVLALVYSGTAGGQDYKTLMVTGKVSEPVLLGDGDPTSVSPDGKWILSLVPSNPHKLILYPTGPGESRIIDISPLHMIVGVSSWTDDGSKVLFTGADQNRPARSYVLDLKSGRTHAVTPEETSEAMISPDGHFVIARDRSLGFTIYRVDTDEFEPLKGLVTGDSPIGWDISSRKVYVWDYRIPAQIFRLDISDGRRERWLTVTPADVSGLLYGDIVITPDGEWYAYHFRRELTNLFLAEYLR